MNSLKTLTFLTCTAVSVVAMLQGAAALDRIGMLECESSASIGLVVGSTRQLTCVFRGPRASVPYTGSISNFGVSVGALAPGRLSWTVYSVPPMSPRGMSGVSLAGSYSGPTTGLAIGPGFDANPLVSSNHQISLQPVPGTQAGLAFSAGIGALTLEGGMAPPMRMRAHRRHRRHA